MCAKFICPECGTGLAKGSTFCMKCGTKMENATLDVSETESIDTAESPFTSIKEDSDVVLEEPVGLDILEETSLGSDDAVLPDVDIPESHDILDESTLPESVPEWDLEETLDLADELPPIKDAEYVIKDYEDNGAVEIDPAEETHEGMPFTEVAPPKVLDESPDVDDEVKSHLFPKGEPSITREAVQHLFPEGRGDTSQDFIDIVVGKPKKIGITQSLQEFVAPDCPDCGQSVTGDGFEYPGYVYEAMGKARAEAGIQKLKESEHEEGIELFEKAKVLFERAQNEKMVAECIRLIDQGYDTMAESHFLQGEQHLKEHEFEWAIVQFKKAREIYMFTTHEKKRAKCAEKARGCYIEWGKRIEHEADQLSKRGESREALGMYQQAAEKYRTGDDSKRLKGLEKKIRRA